MNTDTQTLPTAASVLYAAGWAGTLEDANAMEHVLMAAGLLAPPEAAADALQLATIIAGSVQPLQQERVRDAALAAIAGHDREVRADERARVLTELRTADADGEVTESWKVTWFPPEKDHIVKSGTQAEVERLARRHAEWHPIVERRMSRHGHWETVRA